MKKEDQNEYRAAILQETENSVSIAAAQRAGMVIIDVRSRAEFDSGSVVGAVSVPLFDENERSVIGTIYAHSGKKQAVDKGFALVEQKLAGLLQGFEPYKDKELAICCARGGMRSRSIVNLLNQSGYRAYQVEGGFKQYRKDTLAILDGFAPEVIVIHGLTGTGKTRILQHLDQAIDLEGLANHRSSLFGGIDRIPNNQRTFEAQLARVAQELTEPPFFIEGESRKIGRVFMPKPLALAMKKGVLVNVTCSMKTRVQRIIEDYPVEGEERQKEILKILKSLARNMGKARVEEMCTLFLDGNLEELVEILLREYYDKRYSRCMQDHKYELELSSESIEEAARKLTEFKRKLLKK